MQKALGLIETIGYAVAIESADAAAKAANVRILGYENDKGGGRITIKLAGDVGAVKAAIAAGSAAGARIGKIVSSIVIPRPADQIDMLIQMLDRGAAKQEASGAPVTEQPKLEQPQQVENSPAPAQPDAPALDSQPTVSAEHPAAVPSAEETDDMSDGSNEPGQRRGKFPRPHRS